MSTERPAFDEAIDGFRAFLRKEGRMDRLFWITRDRITGHRSMVWIFRPREFTSDLQHRELYEALQKKKTNIRIATLCELSDGVVAYVEDSGGDSGFLNYAIKISEHTSVVNSRLHWWMVSAYCRLLGQSPFLHDFQIPNSLTRR